MYAWDLRLRMLKEVEANTNLSLCVCVCLAAQFGFKKKEGRGVELEMLQAFYQGSWKYCIEFPCANIYRQNQDQHEFVLKSFNLWANQPLAKFLFSVMP